MIKAEIIKDSVTAIYDESLKPKEASRITTWVLTYPRFIHAEFMTHRVFSRNAASSRAIPISKMIKAVIKEPAAPVYWGANQKGMQAATELKGIKRWLSEKVWYASRYLAVAIAYTMYKLGLHKQIANRVLEPWSHMTVIATVTDMGNFFKLRAHRDAQPEFQELAYKMLEAYNKSVPQILTPGEWHIPFDEKLDQFTEADKIRIATARCARVSYLTFDGKINYEEDLKLHNRLSESGHWSPFEHCAMAQPGKRFGNFVGWKQYRKFFSNENASDPRINQG